MQNYFNTFYCGDALTEHIAQELPLQSCKQSIHAAPAKSQGLAEQLSHLPKGEKPYKTQACMLTEELAVAGAALYAPHHPEVSKGGSGMV